MESRGDFQRILPAPHPLRAFKVLERLQDSPGFLIVTYNADKTAFAQFTKARSIHHGFYEK
jgi:hypothetical protein